MGIILSFPTGEPISDFANYDYAKEKALAMRPKCMMCGEHIQDDMAYVINGALICEKCMDDFKVNVEELIQ